MSKYYQGKIPFYRREDLDCWELSAYGTNTFRYRGHDGREIDNQPFEAVVMINGYSRGRSSATFDLRVLRPSADDKKYEKFIDGLSASAFMVDALEMMTKLDWQSGISSRAQFCFTKKGTNYGLMLLAYPDMRAEELYCQFCGELLSEHLITERGGECRP